jgi:hypothetical protein
MEQAQEARDVVLGMFFINSKALPSSISAAYVEEHNLPIALLKCQMIVSSLGGES